MERLGLLTQLILKRAHMQGAENWGVATPAQAAALAGELARLLDSLQIEDVAIERLADGLVPDRFAAHWKRLVRRSLRCHLSFTSPARTAKARPSRS